MVNTKTMAWELAEQLKSEGFSAESMHGSMSQNARAEVVRGLKESTVKLVVPQGSNQRQSDGVRVQSRPL